MDQASNSENSLIRVIDNDSLTEEELEQKRIDLEQHAIIVEQYELQKQEKEDRKNAALAKLSALGIEQEEISALLG